MSSLNCICDHCGTRTRIRIEASLFLPELTEFHCRACERKGGLRAAILDRASGTWRPRTPEDPCCDPADVTIHGRPVTLVEMEALSLTLETCDARRGDWLTAGDVFFMRGFASQRLLQTLRALIAAGALERLGLEVEHSDAGPRFRATNRGAGLGCGTQAGLGSAPQMKDQG
jgi:hypothetical protein